MIIAVIAAIAAGILFGFAVALSNRTKAGICVAVGTVNALIAIMLALKFYL